MSIQLKVSLAAMVVAIAASSPAWAQDDQSFALTDLAALPMGTVVTSSAILLADAAEDQPTSLSANDESEPSSEELGEDYLNMSLEELLAQEVTSVAKKSRRVGDSAAAVTVITQEDIRRSSARTVPDLLRMVPGMEIAEVQSSATSVSTRGFTSRFAANLLVMVDGAAIYSTSISGMFWDQALIPLQDIERIEVIRGPGGSIWGSNSVAGVVNIITKQSIDTQGLRVNASIGTFDQRAEFGFGKQVSDNLGFRIYGDYRENSGLDGPNGSVEGNSWKGGLAGLRFDYAPTSADNIVILGEVSRGNFSERFVGISLNPLNPGPYTEIQTNKFSSYHALARWKHSISDDLDFTLQGYFNDLGRTEVGSTIDRKLYDLSAEGRWRVNDTHELNFGIGGRISRDKVAGTYTLSLPSKTNTDRWLTGYLQDDISLIPDRLRLTLGSKFEFNNFTGTELQPSARLFYRVNPKFAAWASVTRAVRTPLLVQREMIANVTIMQLQPGYAVPIPVNATFYGTKEAKSERVVSYEIGARGELGLGWTFDAAAFYSDHNRLMTGDLISQSIIYAPAPYYVPVGLQVNYTIGNGASGTSKGFEILVSGPLTDWWKTELSYSYLDLKTNAGTGTFVLAGEGYSPHHQIRVKSDMKLTDKFSFTSTLHYVGASENHSRKAYSDLDVRASYRLNSQIELSFVGSNLLQDRRLEYHQESLPLELVYVPRSAFIEARVRF